MAQKPYIVLSLRSLKALIYESLGLAVEDEGCSGVSTSGSLKAPLEAQGLGFRINVL